MKDICPSDELKGIYVGYEADVVGTIPGGNAIIASPTGELSWMSASQLEPVEVSDNYMHIDYGYSRSLVDPYLIKKPKKTIMTKLNTMMKKLLDTDTQTLVKAGFINGDLELTSEGRNELWTLIFDQHKAALVEAAKAKIAEEEKE